MESMTQKPSLATDREYERRWGDGEVDLSIPNLPSLKIGWIADRLPRKAMRVLDYGCGEGKLIRTLKRLESRFDLYGTDVQKTKEETTFPFFLKTNDTAPLFNGEKFDAIVSVDVLEHVHHIPTCLTQIKKQLNPDGSLYLFIPAEGQLFSFYNLYRIFLGKDLYKHTKDHYPYTRKELIGAVAEQFDIIELNYAYHVLGSLMDSTFFAACRIPAVEKWWWTKNSIYRPNEKKGLASYVLELANAICFWESKMLRKFSFGASGLLIHAKPKNEKNI